MEINNIQTFPQSSTFLGHTMIIVDVFHLNIFLYINKNNQKTCRGTFTFLFVSTFGG